MSDKKYLVPDGMLKAFDNSLDESMDGRQGWDQRDCHAALEAAIRWLAENPIVPTTYAELPAIGYCTDSSAWGTKGTPEYEQQRQKHFLDGMSRFIEEWQRRMFEAPEPEVPDAVKDLLWDEYAPKREKHDADVIEAYQRGKSGK